MNKEYHDKKIMFVTPRMVHGGTERMVSLLSFAFEKNHHAVTTIIYEGPVEFPLAGSVINLDLGFSKRYFKKFFNIIHRVFELRRVIDREHPSIILSYLGNIAPILTGKQVIVNIQTHYERMSWIDRLALKTIYHFKNVQGVIVPAEGLKKSLEKNTGLTNIVTIPNAVDLDSIQKMIVVPLQKNSRKSIVAVGRMVAIKRFDYLIRTFAKSTMCHDVDLVLVGGGEELDSLKKLAVDLGLANVKFIGQSDNPYHYMADARCLVVTSEMETFANVIIESFACGTPVVSVDCDFGPREIIRDSIDGYLVPLDDDQLLMQRIQEIVMNDETYQSMRINALERAQDFSVPMTIKRWEDFFEKIEDDKVIKI